MKLKKILPCLFIFLICFSLPLSSQNSSEEIIQKIRKDNNKWNIHDVQKISQSTSDERLMELLDDDNWAISYVAYLALGMRKGFNNECLKKVFEKTDFTGEKSGRILDILDMVRNTKDSSYLHRLVELLNNPAVTPNTKGVVLRTIFSIPGKQSWEILLKAAGDKEPKVRRASAAAISERWDEPAPDILISLTEDTDKYVRKSAAEALGRVGDDKAVDALIPLCRDEDRSVKLKVVWVLGNLREKKAAESLNMLIAHEKEDKELVLEAKDALRKIAGGKRTLTPEEITEYIKIQKLHEKIIEIRRKDNPYVNRDPDEMKKQLEEAFTGQVEIYKKHPNLLVYHLRKITELTNDPSSMPWNIGLLFAPSVELMPKNLINWPKHIADETEGSVFRHCAIEFGEDTEDLLPILSLIASSEDLPRLLRTIAMRKMERIGVTEESSVDVLIKQLLSEDQMLKTSAISALGKMKAKEAVPHLKKILKDGLSQWGEKDAFSPTRHYIGQVVYALASIEADKSIEIVRPLLESDDKNLQEIAISTLGNLDTPESFEFLKGKLMDANVNIADKAGVYINSHRGDDRKQLLIEAINERRKQGLSPLPETAWILCCIPGKDGLELALQFLEAEEPKYRRAAAKALGSRFEAIEALKKQLEKEKDKTVISTIKQSLRNLNVVLD